VARQLQQYLCEVLVQQPPRRTLRDDAAVIEYHDLIAQQLGLFHVVGREDDGLALRLDRLHQLPEVAPRLRIESGCRLIEEQHVGVVDERDGKQQPLLLSAGELAIVAPGELLERAQAQQLIDRQPVVVQPAEQTDALAHREEILQCRLLEEDARLFPEAAARRLAPVADLARGRREDSLHDLDRGGLAGTIRSQKAEADARGDAERDAGDCGSGGVHLDEVADLEDGRAHNGLGCRLGCGAGARS
jgi:hypothetical protein